MKRNLIQKLFARKVILFGKAVPVAGIALALSAVGALAWGIISFQAAFQVRTADAVIPPAPVGVWDCVLTSGTDAVIDTCGQQDPSGGPELRVSGLSEDDLQVRLERVFANSNPYPVTVTLTGSPNARVPVCLVDNGLCVPSLTIPASGSFQIKLDVKTLGIGPGENIDFNTVCLTWSK